MKTWNNRFTLPQSDAQTAPASRSAMSDPSSWIADVDSIGLESPSCAGKSGTIVRWSSARWAAALVDAVDPPASNVSEPSGTFAGTNGERRADSLSLAFASPEW